ncbi:hypothetical protein Hanom_Chr10g00960921 [Helianthus anomalus]
MTSRARAQSSSGSTRLVYTPQACQFLYQFHQNILENLNKIHIKNQNLANTQESYAITSIYTDPLEGRSTLRPAVILVFGWVGGKHACVDLTGVSPLVGLGSSAFTVGQVALKASSGKVIKHEKACLDNQHVLIPFAFDTFGFLAPEAVDLLSRVQRVMHSNDMTPRSMNVVFKRLSFAIQKGVAAQLVARLPTIST